MSDDEKKKRRPRKSEEQKTKEANERWAAREKEPIKNQKVYWQAISGRKPFDYEELL